MIDDVKAGVESGIGVGGWVGGWIDRVDGWLDGWAAWLWKCGMCVTAGAVGFNVLVSIGSHWTSDERAGTEPSMTVDDCRTSRTVGLSGYFDVLYKTNVFLMLHNK